MQELRLEQMAVASSALRLELEVAQRVFYSSFISYLIPAFHILLRRGSFTFARGAVPFTSVPLNFADKVRV